MVDQRVVPMFSYEDVGRAADWIADAFGFEETGRWSDESGRVTHLNMELDGGMIMLGYPSADYQSPKHHAEVCDQARTWRETPYVVDGLYVMVDDVDAHYERAQAAGATILSELEDDTGIGRRQYRVEDLEGHRWMFATRLERPRLGVGHEPSSSRARVAVTLWCGFAPQEDLFPRATAWCQTP
jgi:PhnB protein